MTGRAPAKIGARIRKLRLANGLSQREVAEPLMTAPYLSLIESGQRTPSHEALSHIARRLGVEVGELETGRPSGLEAQLELELQEGRRIYFAGGLEEAEQLLAGTVGMAQKYRVSRLEARARIALGAIFEARADFTAARDEYDAAQALLADEPVHVRFEAVIGYARCVRFLGNPRLGTHLLESYRLELEQQKMDDPTAKMRVLSSLVHFYLAIGYERRAAEAAEEAIRLAPQVDDPEQIACMNMNVARALLDQGRHDDAIEMLKRAEQIYQSFDWPLPTVRVKINRGIAELGKGRFDAACATFSEVVDDLETKPEYGAELGAALNFLGKAERLRGNAVAVDHLKRARKLLAHADVFELARNAHELGLALSDSDPARARKELKSASDDL